MDEGFLPVCKLQGTATELDLSAQPRAALHSELERATHQPFRARMVDLDLAIFLLIFG